MVLMSKKKEVDEFPFITKWGNDLMDKQGQFINMVVDREESINKILKKIIGDEK